MWHEARKQERKIRGMLVDYRKRAERRQDFYERIVSTVTGVRQGGAESGGLPRGRTSASTPLWTLDYGKSVFVG